MIATSDWDELNFFFLKHARVFTQENERLRMCSVQRDLDGCYRKLSHREAELQERILWLGEQVGDHQPNMCTKKSCGSHLQSTQLRAGNLVQALAYKRGKNMAAAKKKMIERARVQSQMERIQNSISMIDMHRCLKP